MERFVQLIVGGGVTMVAGLWLLQLPATEARIVGVGLTVGGVIAVAVGINSQLEY